MSRVLVTRAREDAERTAEELRRLGHEPIIAPGAGDRRHRRGDSARDFRRSSRDQRSRLRHAGAGCRDAGRCPVFVVGAKTAEAARARGLHVEASAAMSRR